MKKDYNKKQSKNRRNSSYEDSSNENSVSRIRINPNEKFKALKIKKDADIKEVALLEKTPLVYWNGKYYEYNKATKTVELVDHKSSWGEYVFKTLREDRPQLGPLRWIWDVSAHVKLKEFYFENNDKMIYFFLSDLIKVAETNICEPSFNKETLENWKKTGDKNNIPALVITLTDCRKKIDKKEWNHYKIDGNFITDVINTLVDTGLYDLEKDKKYRIRREVYFIRETNNSK